MKVDVYTKFILTVIGVALVVIALKPGGGPLVSTGNAQGIREAERMNVNIESIAGRKLRTVPMSLEEILHCQWIRSRTKQNGFDNRLSMELAGLFHGRAAYH